MTTRVVVGDADRTLLERIRTEFEPRNRLARSPVRDFLPAPKWDALLSHLEDQLQVWLHAATLVKAIWNEGPGPVPLIRVDRGELLMVVIEELGDPATGDVEHELHEGLSTYHSDVLSDAIMNLLSEATSRFLGIPFQPHNLAHL